MDTNKAQKIIDQLVSGLQELKACLSGEQVQSLQANEEDLGSFDKLKVALESDRWPEAVNISQICDPTCDASKTKRARGIVELMIDENLTGKKFLDYGCGDGHVVSYVADKLTNLSVGYDRYDFAKWKEIKQANAVLSTSYENVKDMGPYDVILLFDVLDHAVDEDPISLLKKVEALLKDDGKIFIRTHPFSSRHATHLYHDLNKAYVHLVFTKEELKQLVPNPTFAETSVGVTMPVATYNNWFDKANLKVITRRDIKETVEPFFKIPKIADRIMKISKYSNFPEFQMSLQFMDFVVGKNLPDVPQTEPQQT